MKKKLKLTKLSKNEFKKVKGGYIITVYPDHSCGCGCYYEGKGGSSTSANSSANDARGLYS